MSTEGRTGVQLPETWAADWMIGSRLGSGAYSTVYRAVRKDHPGVDAAIKIISIPSSESERDTLRTEGFSESQTQQYYDEITRQYIAEIEIMESLKGTQHIVGIEDYKVVRREDIAGNRIYIRMELLRSLDSVLQQRILTGQEITRLGMDICSALELCEARHIIHRDVKPANIFINDKTPGHTFYKLGDFGIARDMGALTHGLSTKGTPAYMAPEVFHGTAYDGRADLYSLGITLYRLLNQNRLPFIPADGFSASIREDAMHRRLSGEPLPPPASNDLALARVVLKACAYHPEDRYHSAAEMRRDLEATLEESARTEQSIPADEVTIDAPMPDIQVYPMSMPYENEETEVLPQAKPRRKRPARGTRIALILSGAALIAAVFLIVFSGKIFHPQPVKTPSVPKEQTVKTELSLPIENEPQKEMQPAKEKQQETQSRDDPQQEAIPAENSQSETLPAEGPNREILMQEEPQREIISEEEATTEGSENAAGAAPEPEQENTGTPAAAEQILLTVDHPEVMTHQAFTFSGFAPGARHLRIELLDEGNGEILDQREADGGVMETTFGMDHSAALQAVLTADYENGEEPKRSEPVNITVKADGSTGPLTILCDSVAREGMPVTGKVYADRAGWYHLWLERIDGERTRLAEYDLQPDTAGYASFFFDATMLEKNGIYEIGAAANSEGKNSTYCNTYYVVTDENEGDKPITLTVDGKTEDGAYLAFQPFQVHVSAPGATALRIFNGNNWDVAQNCEAIDWQWFFGRGQQVIVAEATYDPVDWNTADLNSFDPNRDLHWQRMSNPIRLEFYAPYGQTDGAENSFDTDTVTCGDYIDVNLTRASETPGAEYSLWLDRQEGEGNEARWEYEKPVDWYQDHGLAPTISMTPGRYRLCMETRAAGYDPATSEREFELTDNESNNGAVCRLLQDRQQTCESNVFFCSAPGAGYIELRIIGNSDPTYWEDRRCDGEDGRFDLFFARSDVYTLIPTVFQPETDDKTGDDVRYQEIPCETMTITVTADGDLNAPTAGEIPVIHPIGEPLKAEIKIPEEAGYASVTLNRIPVSGDWVNVFYRDGEPSNMKQQAGLLPAEALSEPGLYRLDVYANATGKNDANTGIDFLVVSEETGKKVSVAVDGSSEERAYRNAGEEIPIVITAPGADAIRLLDGNRNWQYMDKRALNEKGEFFFNPAYNSGTYLITAQACYDTGIDWNTLDWDSFDWNTLNWSETGNAVRIEVTAKGKLEAPTVKAPESISRGEWIEVMIGDVPEAETYTLWIEKPNPDSPAPVYVSFKSAGIKRIPTAGLLTGENYYLHVCACTREYDNGDAIPVLISVGGEEPEAEFRIEPTDIPSGGSFLASVWVPGAQAVRLCHEEPENIWSEMPSIAGTFVCEEAGDYVFRAFALRENEEKWEPVGEPITVHVTEKNLRNPDNMQ